MFRRVLIRPHERGLRFRGGEFIAPLEPGQYTLFVPPWEGEFETVEAIDTLKTRFDHPQIEALLLDSELREHLVVAELSESQRGVVYRDGKVFQLIGPGMHAFWKGPAQVEIEVVDTAGGRLPADHPRATEIAALPAGSFFLNPQLTLAK